MQGHPEAEDLILTHPTPRLSNEDAQAHRIVDGLRPYPNSLESGPSGTNLWRRSVTEVDHEAGMER
jgi:hypothetical protein